ncbi:CBS domain-containing protein [Candidatus Gottesmanbacteria bacterium]|nr:CBS domain-containing protein [Candidatus Gottesmanbacteria bacterium]
MKVWQVMQKNPLVITPDTNFSQAWDLLFQKHKHSLPVVDKKNKLVGIVAIEDVVKQLYPSYSDTLEEFLQESTFDDLEDKIDDIKYKKVEKFMNKLVVCTFKDDPALKALSKMVVKRVRQLPVIDYDETLLGIVSKRDIFDKLFRSKKS